MQFIDVRDLGAWIVDLSEGRQSGTFNATHPGVPWGELIDSCTRVVDGAARIVWVSGDFLQSTVLASGWSCRCGFKTRSGGDCTRRTFRERLARDSISARSMTAFGAHSSTLS